MPGCVLMDDRLHHRASLERMLVSCIPTITTFVRAKVKDRQLVEEVVQEVCLQALAQDAPPDPESFSRWCCDIARHAFAREWYHRRRAYSEKPLDETLPDPAPLPDRVAAARGAL